MESTKRWLVLASVLSSRVVYTINWFNISPALPIIQSDLKIDQASIGLLTSSFLLGAGLFQIPAGVLSSRWGPKNTSQLGMLTLSLSAIGEGVSPNFPILFTSRFLLGIGAALFFAPAIGVLTPLFKHDEEGFVMGLYSAMFNVGGGLGLFAWAFLVEVWNWHVALVLGGIIGVVLVMFGQVVIPKDVQVLTGQAGLIASLIMFAAILGGPVGGRASDLLRQRKVFMLIPGFAVALGLALIGIAPPDQMWLLIPIIGFMDAIVFSIEYASASQFPEVGQKYASLAISFMNSAQILGSFGVPIVFAILGYPLGWYFLGGVAAATLLLVFWIQEPFKANGQGLG